MTEIELLEKIYKATNTTNIILFIVVGLLCGIYMYKFFRD